MKGEYGIKHIIQYENMSKLVKIAIIMIVVIALASFQSVQASGFSDIISQGSSFIEKGSSSSKITEDEAINQFLPIGRVLVQIATIVLIVVGLILGIKYMLSGADEKANIKQKLIWYVISVVLVYGAVGIFNIVRSIMDNIF